MSRLRTWWARLSRSDRVALIVAECFVAVFSAPAMLGVSNDWQTAVTLTLILFALLQLTVLFLMWVVFRTRRTRASMPTKYEARAGNFLATIFGVVAAYAAGGYVLEWMLPESEFATKWRYSLEKDLDNPIYMIDKHGHDCEFMTAPLGNKHCHYEKDVAIIRVRTGSSGRLMSLDGRTWLPAPADTRATVRVSWRKVEE